MAYKTKAELTAEALEMGITADQLEGLTMAEISALMDAQSPKPSDADTTVATDGEQEQAIQSSENLATAPQSSDTQDLKQGNVATGTQMAEQSIEQSSSVDSTIPESTDSDTAKQVSADTSSLIKAGNSDSQSTSETEAATGQTVTPEQDSSGKSTAMDEESSDASQSQTQTPEVVSVPLEQEPIPSTTETEVSVDTVTVPPEQETSGLSATGESAPSDETSSSESEQTSQQAHKEDGQSTTPATPEESSNTPETIQEQAGGGSEQKKTSGESVHAQILKCAAELHPDYHEGEENGQMLSLIDSILGGTQMAKIVLRRALGIVGADVGDPNDALTTLMNLSKDEILSIANV